MSRNSLQDLGDGPALLQLFHWTVIGWGWVWLRVCLLGSKISISFSWRDSHSLDVDVNQEVQLSFHGKHLRDSKKPTQLMSGCIIKKLTLSKITSYLLPASLPFSNVPSCLGPQEVPHWLLWDGPCLQLVFLCQLSDPPYQSGDSKNQGSQLMTNNNSNN